MDKIKETAFLFDLDGVIIDSEGIYTEIWSRIERAFPTGIEDFAHVIKGTTLDNILSTHFPSTRVQVEEMLYKEENTIRYRTCSGAEGLLAELNARRVPVSLVTSSNDIKMSHLWEQMPHLREMFDHIVTSNDVTRSKPDPEGYLIGASRAGVEPRRCAVVEDSVQGVKAGRNAGAYVIGLAGTMTAEALRPHCDIVVNSHAEIDVDRVLEILGQR